VRKLICFINFPDGGRIDWVWYVNLHVCKLCKFASISIRRSLRIEIESKLEKLTYVQAFSPMACRRGTVQHWQHITASWPVCSLECLLHCSTKLVFVNSLLFDGISD
jgi:hypothetical protein